MDLSFVSANWPQLLLFVVAFNLFLGGVHMALAKIKDVTVSTWDNTADGYVVMVMGWLQKLIDLFGGNIAH